MDNEWLTRFTMARPPMDKYDFPAKAYIITDGIDDLSRKFMTIDVLRNFMNLIDGIWMR